ncbi:small neutral amino acid transporter SnatA (MarC family) [Methanofollis sp. W23]|uniref:hypothetical protein n=1 Tax=Methanofollis sp. W23 TaxID=2817849 RepID=UPI001AE962EF|nr:hypothetical protein [Methanofollis sp. W23]MBP2146813.1 small neutral amino acid transporter SnatA (MarC family) [Methanofollis sp. W23]
MTTMFPLLDLFLVIFIGMEPVKVLLMYMALTMDASPAVRRNIAGLKRSSPLRSLRSSFSW